MASLLAAAAVVGGGAFGDTSNVDVLAMVMWVRGW